MRGASDVRVGLETVRAVSPGTRGAYAESIKERVYTMQREVRAGRQTGGHKAGTRIGCAAQATCGVGETVRAVGPGTRGAYIKHFVHGRDLGGVEIKRLIERPRVLPSQ